MASAEAVQLYKPSIGGAGMVGCGASRSFAQLLAWRWVTGLGSALQMSGAQLYLADISASSNRARTMGTNQVHAQQTLPAMTTVACNAACNAQLMELPHYNHAQQRRQAALCTELSAHDGSLQSQAGC